MRPDLNKVLCERERRGSHHLKHKAVRRSKKHAPDLDPEEGGHAGREGMKHRYVVSGDTKSFSENLNPLQGIVRKWVNRPWNKFFSELCKTFNMRSVINQHILQHLYQYVEKETFEKDGVLYVREHQYTPEMPLALSNAEFYVDLRGIIRLNRDRVTYRQIRQATEMRRLAEEGKVLLTIDKGTVLRKIEETWFTFDVRPIPVDVPVYDSFRRTIVKRTKDRWSPTTYHTNRRTTSRKLLRAHGL